MKQQQATIQAQSQQMDDMKKIIDDQARRIEALNQWSLKVSEALGIEPPAGVLVTNPSAGARSAAPANGVVAGEASNGTRLLQNIPNPSNGYTEIFYNLAESVTGAISIIDQQGRVWKTFNNLPKGTGKVVVNRGDLEHGTYTYTLLANGQVNSTRQLVIVR